MKPGKLMNYEEFQEYVKANPDKHIRISVCKDMDRMIEEEIENRKKSFNNQKNIQ